MKEKNKIQFYIYPDGLADTMGQDEIVLVRDSLGSLNNKHVGDLVNGDYYCERIPNPLPPRNADKILEYIAKNQVGFSYIKNEYNEVIIVEAYKGDLILCQMHYEEPKTIIRDLIEPIMDMEEL